MNEELKAIECLLEALQDDLIDPEAFAAEFRKNQQRHGVALLPQSLTAAFLRRSVENSADKILGGAAQLLHDAQDVFVSEARRWIEADLVPSWAGTLDAEQCKAARRRLGTRELVPFLQSQTDSWIGPSLYVLHQGGELTVDVDISEAWSEESPIRYWLVVEVQGDDGAKTVVLEPSGPVASFAEDLVGSNADHWTISVRLRKC